MIILCSVGISQYRDLDCIPCATVDAKQVYLTFQNVLNDSFCASKSVCLDNITYAQFETFVEVISDTLSEEDTLVLYFSGHGEVDSKGFSLFFVDGKCSSVRISAALESCRSKIVLIFDCCQSGGATVLASDTTETNQISVLASCGKFENSQYCAMGSKFTVYLCKALYSLSAEGESISLSTISQKIDELGYHDSILNIGANTSGDCMLAKKNAVLTTYNDFPERFLRKLEFSSPLLREALWYSLVDIPDSVVKIILKKYFRCTNPQSVFFPEDSWLIRRAIGSIVAQLNDGIGIIKSLIQSLFWQEQCIGIIGARYLFEKNDDLYKLQCSLINKNSIVELDPLWLSNLYMSDCSQYNCEFFIRTGLGKTTWGIIEIFKTLNSISSEEYVEMLRKQNVQKGIIDGFYSYIKFGSNQNNKLFSTLVAQSKRGRLPEKTKNKFLLSALYGTWRGSINLSLENYFDTTESGIVLSELQQAEMIPDIDYKMAIFEFFAFNPALMEKYSKSLEWGLVDVHPRVRTSAIKAFRSINYSEDRIYASVTKNYDSVLFPGMFDLFLECPKTYYQDLIARLNSSTRFTQGDIKGLIYNWKI